MDTSRHMRPWDHIRSGDRQEFEVFYRAHAGRILQFLYRMTGGHRASEDITQEVFLTLWERPNGFDPGRGSLISYVFGIARKRGSEWWRRRLPMQLDAPDSGLDPAVAPRPKPADAESSALMDDVFARLQTDDRCLLWLREVQGHSYAELAEIIGIPIGMVRSRLFAAREELRGLWRAHDRNCAVPCHAARHV